MTIEYQAVWAAAAVAVVGRTAVQPAIDIVFTQRQNVVAAAQERGRARAPWTTAQELLKKPKE